MSLEGGRGKGDEGMGGRGGMTVIHIILMAQYIQTNNEDIYLWCIRNYWASGSNQWPTGRNDLRVFGCFYH